jgi:hypothetical protein
MAQENQKPKQKRGGLTADLTFADVHNPCRSWLASDGCLMGSNVYRLINIQNFPTRLSGCPSE